MLNIRDLYKFYINHPVRGLIEVFPYNSTIEWAWEKNKESNEAFKRKKLTSTLVFKKDQFFIFYDLDRSKYRCEKILIEVHRACDEIFTLFWSGYIALIDGEYDRDKCSVTLKVRNDDEYTCILNSYGKEKDFIGGIGAPASVEDVKFTQGEIESKECISPTYYEPGVWYPEASNYPQNTSCLDNPSTWTFVTNVLVNVRIYQPDPRIDEYAFEVESRFIREKIITLNSFGPPSGDGWTVIANDGTSSTYVRPASANFDTLSSGPIKNGRKLNDVIQYLLTDCELTLVSDFFNYNPDNSHPQNFAYTYAETYYKDLIIWQKSDVKRQPRRITNSNGDSRILPFESATKAFIKLKELLDWLNKMYNVQWAIIGNTFRVEHYTFWKSSRQNLIDLTENKAILGNYNYKYISEELPSSETWKWMEETDKKDFDGTPIIYSETCSYDDNETKDEEYPINKVTTNIEYIITNPSEISDTGFVIASTENSVIQSDLCKITNQVKLNGPNALSNLLYYLHRHGRPQRQGTMNNEEEEFFFPTPKRQGPEIVLPMCCEEIETFDTNFRVKTQLGWGDIDTAKFSDPRGLMTLNLLHE